MRWSRWPARLIDWQAASIKFGALYAPGRGRPAISIRLMVGLHYLKHVFNLSDEQVVMHYAPDVECIAKGKAYKQYESGVKVSVVSTSRDNFVVGMQALPGNPYDGHSLEAAIGQTITLTGITPKQAFVDRGYKGHKLQCLSVWIAGTKRGLTTLIKKWLKRRNAIEPVIGHMKTDGRLARNFLKGAEGDAMNAILCAAGHNLRKILCRLASFLPPNYARP